MPVLVNRGLANLRANNPCNSPSRKSKSLSKSIDDQNIIFVNILNIFSCTYSCAITVTCVIVTTIEFVHDQRGSVPADVLDLSELGVFDNLSCRIAGVGGKDN
jgi:hypothetical protein